MREFDLLAKVYDRNAQLPASVVIPPGDDMGAIVLGGQTLLLAVDQIIDGVHFSLADTPIQKIGRKAITRNLSDVAAMAALPVAAVASVALPRGFEQADALAQALAQTGLDYGCPVIGGDVAAVDGPLSISVTVLADPAGIEPVLRRGSQVGDYIYVTGVLGGSLASGHHLDFEPRIALARQLPRPHAMIDLSDGLARDLKHLVSGARLDHLPIREGCTWQQAVGDGEDYELLFTHPDKLPCERQAIPVTCIGQVTDGDDIVLMWGGHAYNLAGQGWEHVS